ncbi:MAG TPA: autotransporter domain-containing protein [Rhizomicrobium sp.]|nr:autotransporter domain-containing protein [Rhizomicrobium sp.]
MKTQILALSAALAACLAAPARADDDPILDITTALTDPVATATAGPDGGPADIVLDTDGSITVNLGGPAVTINSNNSFEQVVGTTISNKGTDSAVGILVDLTTHSLDATNDNVSCGGAPPCHAVEGIVENGTIDLSGAGGSKRGIWLEAPTVDLGTGPFSFTGDIDMSGSTITVTGDNGVGVLIDQLAVLNGDLTFGTINVEPTSKTASTVGVIGVESLGVINGDVNIGLVNDETTIISDITATGSTNQSASGTIGVKLGGTIHGNVNIGASSKVIAYGTGAEGVLITGDIKPCNISSQSGCSSLGALINSGIIETASSPDSSGQTTGNATPSTALGVGGDVADGIINEGPTSLDDHTVSGTISGSGVAPVVEISPGLQDTLSPKSQVIGIRQDELVDPGFSFYNRGSILGVAANVNQDSNAVFIGGVSADATVTLTGGMFNSGIISSTVVMTTDAKNAGTANAIVIGNDAYVGFDPSTGRGDTYVYDGQADRMVYQGLKTVLGDQAALVNSNEAGSGQIVATISGPFAGDSAVAIDVLPLGTLPSIINQGLIQATATSGDTTISGLNATAILDQSGTLTYIENNGVIEALATPLDDDSQTAVAIDLSADKDSSPAGQGVEILDQATTSSSASIVGDIKFGSGDHQIVRIMGVSTDETASITGDIHFGGGSVFGTDELIIGNFATLQGAVTADNGVSVDVQSGGTFVMTNDSAALNAQDFHVRSGGTLDLTVFQDFTTGIVDAKGRVVFDGGALFNITYGSFVPQDENFVLFTTPTGQGNLVVTDLDAYNAQLEAELPFLFQDATLSIVQNPDLLTQSLVLHVDPKTADQLGLTGYAVTMLPVVNQALANDNPLGAAMVAGIVDQKTAQQAYDAFAPNVTGAERAIAMSLTDQATGPVAARQRILRMYGKESGEVTLWGQEFAQFIKDPGDTSTGKTGYKDHGWGFVLGMDGGDPKTGWYGGALTFFSGDVVEPLPRDTHTNSLWYMLTGYTDWRGKGLFLDTKIDVGYVDLKEKRFLSLSIPGKNGAQPTQFVDEADSHRPGLVGAAGFTTGVILAYGSTTFTPQFSFDGMTYREEGYSETHPTNSPGNGKGFDLTTSAYYANSLRAFLGADVREDLQLGDFFLQPDVRLGYRYDFINDPQKLTAHFTNVASTGVTPGPNFTLEGPDPSQGNFVAGASLSATTDAWTLGANFDFVRGENGATTEVGTIHLLGRI